MPCKEIVTRGFGQNELLVAIPGNDREPLNGRVEFVLHQAVAPTAA